MANEQNLVPFNERTESEQREIARMGGIASGQARAARNKTKELCNMIDKLPVKGPNRDKLEELGIPEDELTQHTLRLVALHKKALSGDANANRLWLEIIGEAPQATVSLDMNIGTREAYERAAAAIKNDT